MKFLVLSVVCLVGVASAFPGGVRLRKRDILPGDPRYGTDHHHHHHHNNDVQTPHSAYGPPNHSAGQPIHYEASHNHQVAQPSQQYIPAPAPAASRAVESVSNAYLAPVIQAAQSPAVYHQPAPAVKNAYLAPAASSHVQQPSNAYLGPQATQQHHHQHPVDSYGAPVVSHSAPVHHHHHQAAPQPQVVFQSQPETYSSNYYSNGFESSANSDLLNFQQVAASATPQFDAGFQQPQTYHVQIRPAVRYAAPQPAFHQHVESVPSLPVAQVSYHEVSHVAPVETSYVDEHHEAVHVESVDHSASHHESSQLVGANGGYVY